MGGAHGGNRTHDHSLTKTVRYRCATRANLPTGALVLVGSGGFEPPKLSQLIYSQSHLATLVTAQVDELAAFASSFCLIGHIIADPLCPVKHCSCFFLHLSETRG